MSQKQLTTVVGPTNSLPRSDFSLVEGQARPTMGQTFTAFNTYVVPGEEQPQSPPPADVGERVALVDLPDTVDLLRLKMARQADPENKADPLEAMFSPL